DGSTFKAKYKFRPYFCAATKDKMEMDVDAYLRRRYEGQIADIHIVDKEDLDLISFDTVQQLMQAKSDLMHVVERNQEMFNATETYESILSGKRYKRR
ncbi:DNA polymerase epsilon catalytic subunit, partial [Tanacetum coccineum]